MIVEDLVMLGKTVPEPSSDGRVFVCSAGVSPELRTLIRIYPLSLRDCPPRWMTCRMALERNPQDSRPESWKMAGDRSPDQLPRINFRITQSEQVPEGRRADLLGPYVIGSIREANERRLSLAIVHPLTQPTLEFRRHEADDPISPQQSLFIVPKKQLEFGSKRFPHNPYLRFEDDGGAHRLQVRDWGVYEFLRKHGDHRRAELAQALHLSDDSSLMVGNFHNHRNAWCVISVLSRIRRPQSLFDLAEVS